MTPLPSNSATDSQLRFVFNQRVASRALAGSVTLGDIARMRGDLPRARVGDPASISITIGRPGTEAPGDGSEPRR